MGFTEMDANEMYSFMKDCLKEFNYPLIHGMTDNEVADVFGIANRCFLISWLLKLMDEEVYQEVLENNENDKEVLSNLIYEFGFCTKKEKLPFMTGKLTGDEQIIILRRMLKFIKKEMKDPSTEENKEPISNDELYNFKNTNLNLFPMFGEIKLPNDSEKKAKIFRFEKEIERLNASNDNEVKDNFLSNNRNEIFDTLEQLRSHFPQIKKLTEDIRKDKSSEPEINIKLNNDSENILKECNKNINVISKFVNNIKTIQSFETDMKGSDNEDNSVEVRSMVNLIAKNMGEIGK